MTLFCGQATVQDEDGNAVAGASVAVRFEGSGLLATLYADKAGLTPLGNPFTSDDNGAAVFYAAAGFYRVTATEGYLITEARDVNIGPMNPTVYDTEGEEVDAFTAGNTRYDNTTSGLVADNVQAALDEVVDRLTFTGAIVVFPTGAALPSSDQGPIWHEDYAGVMTWQVFNANGASYTGYASLNIGDMVVSGQSTAKPGTLKYNGADLSATTYAPLYHWAKHNGVLVASGSWATGRALYRENGDGTFRVPDLRGIFVRGWSDGSSVDSGRAMGSGQGHALESHTHSTVSIILGLVLGAGGNYAAGSGTTGTPSGSTATETRPINAALLYTLKY
jgi:hypothetical protein